MWQLLTRSRNRIVAKNSALRRHRWYRPRCQALEDRQLLSVTLTPGTPSGSLVGAPVVWTATASGDGTTPVYQFSVTPPGGPAQMVQDYSSTNSFTWDPMQEGTYQVQVNVETNYGTPVVDTRSASYTVQTRIVGNSAVVSPTTNPLVALYSAPPSSGTSMYVQFSPEGANPSWTNTSAQPIVPGKSTNVLVAGMLPNTTYLIRSVNNGVASAPLTFTTGSLPTDLTFPTFTVLQPPAPGTDLTQTTIYHTGTGQSASNGVQVLSTNLAGQVNWYYDPLVNNFSAYGPTILPGGTVFLLGGTFWAPVRSPT